MVCLVIELGSSTLEVQPNPLYNGIGRIQGSLRVLVYGLCALESRRVLQRCNVDR
jgi:hypothetical protein